MGTQWWVENDQEKFLAYYGSREAYDAIKSWDDVRPAPLEKNLDAARRNGEAPCRQTDDISDASTGPTVHHVTHNHLSAKQLH